MLLPAVSIDKKKELEFLIMQHVHNEFNFVNTSLGSQLISRVSLGVSELASQTIFQLAKCIARASMTGENALVQLLSLTCTSVSKKFDKPQEVPHTNEYH